MLMLYTEVHSQQDLNFGADRWQDLGQWRIIKNRCRTSQVLYPIIILNDFKRLKLGKSGWSISRVWC